MTRTRGVRTVLAALAVAGALAATTAWAPAGHGHPGRAASFACSGREDITYGGLHLLSSAPTPVTVDGVYHCTVAPGREVTATYHTEGTTGGECVLFAPNQSRETLRYRDGSTTVIAYRSGPSTRLAGVNTATLHGVVVAGRGKGATAEKTIQTLPAALPTDCALPGGLRHTTAFTHLSVEG
ncbi:hypothetical protein GCM10010218_07030 [Streptomyces mashuensis]|uniref:Secreted protein n=1 Tax=Streptomyces mashuensis TaxID=33904 RepID=A0A919AWL6_9ACTN|nr:hypothetical protein [Streptomyces mashuensis]GHF28489.1 hypothetical protein GCM10010218_07030 [Streptomyces mashuensis]